MSRTLGEILALRCSKCGHGYGDHVGNKVVGRFGRGSGLEEGSDFKIVGCTVEGCKCKHPRFKL